jgi:Zn-dependent protease
MPMSSMPIRLLVTPGALVPAVLLLLLATAQFGNWSAVGAAGIVSACLLLHELAHVSVALLTGTRVHAIGINVKGPFIQRSSASSPLREACIAVVGPLVNVSFALWLWGTPGVLQWVAQMNAILAVTNMLPISGSDGQRILGSLRAHRLARKPPSTASTAGGTVPTTAAK